MSCVITLEEKDIGDLALYAPSERLRKYNGGTFFSCMSHANAIILQKLLCSLGYENSTIKHYVQSFLDADKQVTFCFDSTYPFGKIEETPESDSSDDEEIQGER